jgi:hypothetical protein
MPLKYELEGLVLEFELCFYCSVRKWSLLFLKEIRTEGRLDRVSSIPPSSERSGLKSEPAYELSEPLFSCFLSPSRQIPGYPIQTLLYHALTPLWA